MEGIGHEVAGEGEVHQEDEVAVEGEVHDEYGDSQGNVEGEFAAEGGLALERLLSVSEPFAVSEPFTVSEPLTVSETSGERWSKKRDVLFIVIMAYGIFSLGTCYSLAPPFFPQEATRKGASSTTYGLVFGAFHFVYLLSSPFWGIVLRYVLPKAVMVAAMIVVGICCICFGVLEYCPGGAPFITLAFIIRIVESLGASAFLNTCYGTLPYLFPNHVGRMISFIQMTFAIGTIVGPTLGGYLLQLRGFYLPFVVMGCGLISGCPMTAFCFKETEGRPQRRTESVWKMLQSWGVILDVLLFTLGSLFVGFNEATLAAHLKQFNLTHVKLGMVFVTGGALFSLSSPVYGLLIDKGVHPHVFSMWGCILCLIAFIIIGPVPGLPFTASIEIVIFSMVLQGLGLGATNVSAIVHGFRDIKRRGFPDNVETNALFNGILSAFYGLGSVIGPSVGGILVHRVDYSHATLLVVSTQSFLIIAIIVVSIKNYVTRVEDTAVPTRPPSVDSEEPETEDTAVSTEPPSVDSAEPQTEDTAVPTRPPSVDSAEPGTEDTAVPTRPSVDSAELETEDTAVPTRLPSVDSTESEAEVNVESDGRSPLLRFGGNE